MRFVVTINVDNDAFANDPTPEVVRLLRETANRLEVDGENAGGLSDINGNSCGGYQYVLIYGGWHPHHDQYCRQYSAWELRVLPANRH